MQLPSISEYADSVASPRGRLRTLGQFEAERDPYGNVRFTAGNSVAVEPRYDDAFGFQGGVARVRLGTRTYLIDHEGRQVDEVV